VGIFAGRRQDGLPSRLPPAPTEWAVPYRKLAKEVALRRILPRVCLLSVVTE
jgi:hypothetical protein